MLKFIQQEPYLSSNLYGLLFLSVTRLGYFRQFFKKKKCQYLVISWAVLKTVSLLSEISCDYFWATFLKMGHFLTQHLDTLITM